MAHRAIFSNLQVTSGKTVKVPDFKTSEEANRFIQKMKGSDKPADHIVDPETGELLIEKGIAKKKALKTVVDTDRKRVWEADDVEDLFNIVTTPLYKVLGETVEQLAKVDIDGTIKVPYLLSRKDGLSPDTDDIEEVQEWLEDEYEWLEESRVSLTPTKSGKRIEFIVEIS